jgi:hypothetical protein
VSAVYEQHTHTLPSPHGETYKFLAILVHSQVNGAEAAAADLLLDHILVYPVHGGAVVVAAAIVRAGIEGFFDGAAARGSPSVVSDGTLVGRHGHVLDHLRAAVVGGRGEIDMDAMAGQDAGGLDL